MPRVDFQLAKELRDAGFPQESAFVALYYDGEGHFVTRYPQLPFPRLGEYRAPNLSSLIEACGERFQSLTRQGDGWLANDVPGVSPEEAVARFWMRECASGV